MSKAAATLSWSAASETYTWSDDQGGERLSLVPDSPAWFAWLSELPSFGFHGKYGSYTARQERRERGERYWYAYRRTGQKLRKKYLGRTNDLTIDRLEQVARGLHAEQISPISPGTAFPAHQAHHEPTRRQERVITPEQKSTEGSPARQSSLLPLHLATKH